MQYYVYEISTVFLFDIIDNLLLYKKYCEYLGPQTCASTTCKGQEKECKWHPEQCWGVWGVFGGVGGKTIKHHSVDPLLWGLVPQVDSFKIRSDFFMSFLELIYPFQIP